MTNLRDGAAVMHGPLQSKAFFFSRNEGDDGVWREEPFERNIVEGALMSAA